MDITVHHLTNRPTLAWQDISKHQTVNNIKVKIPSTPVSDDKVRFVCMSDTHSQTHNLQFGVPDGDVFIHAGDFTKSGKQTEVEEFNNWLASLPHTYKIVICGNHELTFDAKGADQFTKLLTNCTYLQDQSIDIYGIKLYGSPWQPQFGYWAFNLERGEACLEKWRLIPDDVDVLVTHGPPLGHGDLASSGVRAGCVELLHTVQQRVKPKYHVFGHIHEGYGVTSDMTTTFINASTCNISYKPENLPIVFDMPLPNGVRKPFEVRSLRSKTKTTGKKKNCAIS